MKIVAILLLLAILLMLGRALLRLIRGASEALWRMLAWRVGFSICLFVLALTIRVWLHR